MEGDGAACAARPCAAAPRTHVVASCAHAELCAVRIDGIHSPRPATADRAARSACAPRSGLRAERRRDLPAPLAGSCR